MNYCASCGTKLTDGAAFCAGCGRPLAADSKQAPPAKRKPSLVKYGLMIGIPLIVAIFAFNSPAPVEPSGPTPAQIKAQGEAIAEQRMVATARADGLPAGRNGPPSPELEFFGAAISYLDTAYKQGTNVATTAAGAENGRTTLSEIKQALSRAKFVEGAGYSGDYVKRLKGRIPPSVADVAARIDEIHRMFQASMTETLEYWDDQNTAHIVSGQATLKRCVLLMNSTVEETRRRMAATSTAQN